MTEVLRVTGLSVALPRGQKLVRVVDDLDLAIGAGEMLALVGQSGCGKTTAALSIPRLLPAGARVSGSIRLGGAELAGLAEPGLRALRGGAIGVVFQDPAAALNPSQRVGAQIAEAIRLHAGVRGHAGVGFRRRADIGAGLSADVGAGRRAAGDGAVERRAAAVQAAGRQAVWEQAVARLAEVGLAEPERRARDYPHQLSGGQRQRVSIAIALAGDPALLIADECTAGLDPVLARQVLDLIGGLRARRAMAVLLVTHDLAQVRRHADTVQVLYAGQAIERGPAGAVLARPLHPYSAMLRAAAPGLRPDRAGPWPMVRLFGGSGAPETDLAAEGSLVPERDVGGAPEPEVRGPSCRFAPRCAGVRPVCSTQPPPWSGQGESQARCFFAGEVTPAWGGPGAVAVASAAGEPVMGEVASAADEPGMGKVVRARGDPAAGGAARGRGEPAAGGVARARSGPEDEAALAATVSRGGQDRGPTPLGAGLAETGATAAGALLALERVSVSYRPRFGGSARLAVREVSLTIGWGECVGLVGASGSGKTSLGRAVLQMLPYEGAIVLGGTRLDGLAPGALRTARARMAVVFQDPAGSLDPAMRVDTLIAEPWRLAGIGRGERRARVPGLLARVGLAQSLAERRAGSLSGGQAQRVALARALAGQPDLLVLDEPTSSVDVWTQAGLLVLLRELLAAGRMGCLFITHDLAVARVLCHRIAVMEGGRLVEVQSAAGLVRAPVHAASRALVAAAS